MHIFITHSISLANQLNFSAFLLALCLLFLSGCGSQVEGDAELIDTKEEVDSQSQNILVLYNWEDYIASSTLSDFEEQTGTKVQLITYEDDEDVISGIQSGAINPDLVILSESVAIEMHKARLLRSINQDVIPNLININYDKFKVMIESGHNYHEYMVPYFTGTTGLAVNTRYISNDYQSWKVLWDSRFEGKIAMLNNPFEVAGTAAKLLGFPINPLPEQLPVIREKLLEQKPLLIGYYDPTTISEMLVEEEIWAAQLYSGDALMASELNNDIFFVIPEEGCALWTDVLIIPQSAENVTQAHKFIDFIHDPLVNAEIASELWVKTLNNAAEQHINPEVINSPVVNPPDEVMALCEFFGDMGTEDSVRGRLQIWSELLSDR